MLHFPHVGRKPCSRFKCCNQPGPGQWCPFPHLKYVPPISCSALRLLNESNMFIKKCAPPCDFWLPCWEILATGLQPTNPVLTLTSLQSGSRSCTVSYPKDNYYLMICFDVDDSVNGEIQNRFNQENFDLYAKCKELLISAASMRERRKLGNSEKAFW